jgi:hypothetical protein
MHFIAPNPESFLTDPYFIRVYVRKSKSVVTEIGVGGHDIN